MFYHDRYDLYDDEKMYEEFDFDVQYMVGEFCSPALSNAKNQILKPEILIKYKKVLSKFHYNSFPFIKEENHFYD